MLVIGLTGTKAGGKGEVAEFLKGKGFVYYSLSDIVREETVKRGIEHYIIKDLQDVGNDLRKEYGMGVLAERTLEKIKEGKDYVIDGIRNPGEIGALRRLENFYLISVDAPPKARFERMQARARESDPKTWKEFLKMDKRDKGEKKLAIGQQVSVCMDMADYTIFNDSTKDDLYQKADEILKKIDKKMRQ